MLLNMMACMIWFQISQSNSLILLFSETKFTATASYTLENDCIAQFFRKNTQNKQINLANAA